MLWVYIYRLGLTAASGVLPNISFCSVSSRGNDKYHCAIGDVTLESGMNDGNRETQIPEKLGLAFLSTLLKWEPETIDGNY